MGAGNCPCDQVMKYTFKLPCHIVVGVKKQKRLPININWYRNAHHFTTSLVKRDFYPIGKIVKFHADKISVHYILVLNNNRKTDLMNWISVIDKFFMDWLVINNYIPDDNTKIVKHVEADSMILANEPESYVIAEIETIGDK